MSARVTQWVDNMQIVDAVGRMAAELARGLVVVGCGANKLPHPAPAAELYTGPYFRSCLSTALAIAPAGRVRILSAKHGLLALDQLVAPYELTLGQPGCITGDELAAQAAELGELGRHVVALCSARYVELLRTTWPSVAAPLTGQGIGQQRHTLALIRQAAKLVNGLTPQPGSRK